MSTVRFDVTDGVGRIVLDRPAAINALTLDMLGAIEQQLLAWRDDDEVATIELSGAGERGYCAGADVRELRELVLADPRQGLDFLRDEYRLDDLVATYPKQITTHLHGISMGGGLGLGTHGTRRVATPDLKWAMPEVGIGLWPDVGMTRQLAHCPGEIGTHLAMSGLTIDAASALYAGLVDEVAGVDPDDSQVAADRAWIDECYQGDDPVAIVRALEEHAEPRAREAGALLRSRAPLSVCVALAAVRLAATSASVSETLLVDLALASNFVDDPDFIEGVRAQLVDKDRNPAWQHATIEDVDPGEVAAMFQPRPSAGWQAITDAAATAHPDQDESLLFRTQVTYEQGGDDPLDAVAVYRVAEPTPHWHYVGYGLTDIYDAGVASADAEGNSLSGFGYELTIRVADERALEADAQPPAWPPALLQVLARHVVDTGDVFQPGSVVLSTSPLVQGFPTELTSVVFIADQQLWPVDGPSGQIRFAQTVGLTSDEAAAAGRVGVESFVRLLLHLYPRGVTDLARPSVLTDPSVAETLGVEPDADQSSDAGPSDSTS